MWYEERHVRADDRIVEMGVAPPARYRLRFGRPGAWLVSYEDGARVVRGRRHPYAFRSVEQLRYDFERDVQDAQRQS